MTIGPIARHIVPKIFSIWTDKVTGLENLPKRSGFIIAPNHCSYMEHFLIGSIVIPYLDRKIYILAKKEHYDDIKQRVWHRYWGQWVVQIPIDRRRGKEGLIKAESYLKKGRILVIYPEGTRSPTGKIQKGRTGISRLAIWSKVPVIPLGITGTFKILPKGKTIPKLKKASFKFGKPIRFDSSYSKKITKKLLRQMTDNIMVKIAKLSNQKYKF